MQCFEGIIVKALCLLFHSIFALIGWHPIRNLRVTISLILYLKTKAVSPKRNWEAMTKLIKSIENELQKIKEDLFSNVERISEIK